MVRRKNKGGNPYPAMQLQEPFPPRHQAGGRYPTLIKWRMLAFVYPATIQGKSSHWKILPLVKLCRAMAITLETFCKAAITASALGTSLLLSSSSTWSCICFEQVLVQKSLSVPQVLILPGAEGPHSPSAALTSTGSDNPPKGDDLDFKALKSQSAGLNLPNSVPDGTKSSWAKLGS